MPEIGTEPPAGDPTRTSDHALSVAGRPTMPLSGRAARGEVTHHRRISERVRCTGIV